VLRTGPSSVLRTGPSSVLRTRRWRESLLFRSPWACRRVNGNLRTVAATCQPRDLRPIAANHRLFFPATPAL